jgi:Animal haem peroxidase
MFPHLPRPDPGNHAIEQLAQAMLAIAGQPGDIRRIPAGYTYLGQFIDHDITFDPTSKLQRDNDPHALVNFRSPRFDLDSLYGSGPRDQPFLYDWDDASHPGVKLLAGDDLPRNARGRALVGDARNDENIIVSQLHLLFANFHNAVVERLRHSDPSVGAVALFEDAQRLVRWHYQWIVVHDFLRRVAGDDVVEARGPSASRLWRGGPSIPVEFSAAAFRFGHSMVRDDYVLNAHSGAVSVLRPDGGFGPLPPELVVDWERFFEIEDAPFPSMLSMRINTSLAAALSHLPPDGAALARLNLERGRALGLPAGRDVAAALRVPPLADGELLLDGIDDRASEALLSATPLWYYVLREAEMTHFKGRRLGPVGGRIVAEVLVGLLEGDPHSYLRHWPAWSPELPRARDDTFTMGDLVSFARRHRRS